ncbi:MAG: FmdB family zinc ribbon protein [Candidatus Caldatribacteriaceae bacterium]
MPTYEYRCDQCGYVTEVQASLAEKEKGLDLTCPHCGSKSLTQVFGGFLLGCSPKGGRSGSHGGGCSCCS